MQERLRRRGRARHRGEPGAEDGRRGRRGRGGDRGGQDRRHHVDRSDRRPRRLRRQADRGQAPPPQGPARSPRQPRPPRWRLRPRCRRRLRRRPRAPATPAAREGGVRALAKPPVRKFAKDLGVDLASVAGSGEGGIITRADVEAHAAGTPQLPGSAGRSRQRRRPAASGPCLRPPGEREQRIPIKGVRKMTAQAMVDSAFTAPHVTEWITVDATATMELVERLKHRPRVQGRQGHAAAGAGQGDVLSRSAATPRSTRRGTRRPRRSWSRTT